VLIILHFEVLKTESEREREREREKRKCGGGERYCNYFGGRGEEVIQFKIPRQCPLILLVMVSRTEGKTLGREKDKAMGRIMFCENGAEETI
jgi:hypothetical protein